MGENMIATEYKGNCKHTKLQEDRTTDTYDSRFGRDDELFETITTTCLDCGSTYNEWENIWYA